MDLVPEVWAWNCCSFSRPFNSLSEYHCFSFMQVGTGVSLSVGLRCADPRCVDMLAGVGVCVDCRVTGFEFLSCRHLLACSDRVMGYMRLIKQ